MRRYQHTQVAWVPLGTIGLAVAGGAAVLGSVGENLVPALLLSLFLLTPLLFFATFTITITDDELMLRSGVGLIRTRVPVHAVRAYERVRKPLYFGWGSDSDSIPGVTLYNVFGFEAVDVSLADGTHLHIGTNEPDALVDALRRVVPARVAPGAQVHVSRGNPILGALAFLFVPAFVVVAAMVYISTRPVTVTVARDQFSISGGIYRDEIAMQDVESVSLEPVLPVVLERTNAFPFGDSLRGHFILQGVGDAHLFVERGSPPYVKVRTTKHLVWINFKDPGRTRDLYATLIGARARIQP